jgi:hypothetical protein
VFDDRRNASVAPENLTGETQRIFPYGQRGKQFPYALYSDLDNEGLLPFKLLVEPG